jgi:hypothetical protein
MVICKLLIYDGSDMSLDISDLLNPHLGQGHEVYSGNYYNSVNRSKQLHERKTATCSIIRQNKGLPVVEETSEKPERGKMTFR